MTQLVAEETEKSKQCGWYFLRGQDMEQVDNRMWKEECEEDDGGGRMGWRQAARRYVNYTLVGLYIKGKTNREWNRCPQDGVMYMTSSC